jgi:thiol:disulfide interchange protein DsbD
MRILRLILAVLFLFTTGFPLFAASSADAPHVHIELLIPRDKLYVDRPLNDAGFYFKLERGWHIYWTNAGDAGFPPDVSWKLPSGITSGALEFPAPHRLQLGSLMDYGYEDEVLLPLKIRVDKSVKAGPATLHAKLSWLVCSDSCIPGNAELEIIKDVDPDAHPSQPLTDPLFNRFLKLIPRPLPAAVHTVFETTKNVIRLTVETGQQEKSAVFFPADPDIIDNPSPQKLTPTPNGLILELKKDAGLSANPAKLKGVLELSGGRAFELTALPAAVTAPTSSTPAAASAVPSSTPGTATKSSGSGQAGQAAAPSFIWAVLLRTSGVAFIGGLLLNLLPCVFPVLFLKGLALVHSGHKERSNLRAHGLVYGAGILVSFWALVAVLLGLRAAGATLGWGFQFQSPIFLALITGLLFFLGLSLAGQFEIGLTLTSAGDSLAQKSGYTGSFFTGVLAVVVATPCTAPFMGAAIGYALSQSAAVTFAVFTALALGLAAPYVALTLQPAWTRWLPKPGAWMEVLRQAVAVPIFVTVIWLSWVAAKGHGADILWTLLGSFLLLAVAGWFLGRWPAKRWATVVAALILLAVVALAIIGQKVAGDASESLSRSEKTGADSAPAGAWEPWSPQIQAAYQSQGRPVFVDFTAAWCLSCQVNERVALNQPQVQQAFHSANVVLLRADWTRHDEAITRALTTLGRSGVPAYVLYIPGESEPRLLPEVLTPSIVINALDKLNKLPNAVSTATH